VLDLGDEPIASTDHRLDDAFAEDAAEVVHVGAEQALAHRDLAPHCLDDLAVGHEPRRVLHEKPQDRERLAPEPDLLVVFPRELCVEIESEGCEGEQSSRASGPETQTLARASQRVVFGKSSPPIRRISAPPRCDASPSTTRSSA
jgi:hypothetical protein